MKNSKLIFTIIILFFITVNGFSQGPPPPPPVMPSSQNEKIIDEIITLSKYEGYFNNYVFNVISAMAIEKKWSEDEVKKQKKTVNFDDFKTTIYNNFAHYTSEELLLLKKFYTSVNKRGQNDNMILISSMIQSNLFVYVSRYTN